MRAIHQRGVGASCIRISHRFPVSVYAPHCIAAAPPPPPSALLLPAQDLIDTARCLDAGLTVCACHSLRRYYDSLVSLGGSFSLVLLPTLRSLDGVNRLGTVGGMLGIERCAGLTSVGGLNSLTTVGGYLQIDNSPMTSIAGLANLTSIGSPGVHACGIGRVLPAFFFHPGAPKKTPSPKMHHPVLTVLDCMPAHPLAYTNT